MDGPRASRTQKGATQAVLTSQRRFFWVTARFLSSRRFRKLLRKALQRCRPVSAHQPRRPAPQGLPVSPARTVPSFSSQVSVGACVGHSSGAYARCVQERSPTQRLPTHSATPASVATCRWRRVVPGILTIHPRARGDWAQGHLAPGILTIHLGERDGWAQGQQKHRPSRQRSPAKGASSGSWCISSTQGGS